MHYESKHLDLNAYDIKCTMIVNTWTDFNHNINIRSLYERKTDSISLYCELTACLPETLSGHAFNLCTL